MPTVRPFRALRYTPDAAPDPALVLSPPYDIISPELQRRLLDRHPKNVVRLDLPEVEPGEEPDDRYRRAARTLAAWRSDGTLHKDPRPSVYAYEQCFRPAGSDAERTIRGYFARLRLEPLAPESDVRPHERTLAAPREDRYRLLRATGVNTSPVVVLHEDAAGDTGRVLESVARTKPDIDVVDDDGVRHRLWVVPADDVPDAPARRLVEAAQRAPVTIADGHHRYETALRYRDERRMSRSCEEDPPFDYLLALFVESTSQALTVLPTHRVVRQVDAGRLVRAAADLFDVHPVERATLETWGDGEAVIGGRGRIGLWTRDGGYALTARRDVFSPWLPAGGPALRSLDVSLLHVALERLAGLDAAAVAGGERIGYTKSAPEAVALVDRGVGGADAAFLLEPTPVESLGAVAAEGDVMPQKSTYFHPKPLSGLVINPHEW